MPYIPNYQTKRVANPYSLQTHEPGRDHGLWDVIGRGIRATVPERANPAFDKTKPVDDKNTPYVKPGFFRAMLGDRGRDYNTDAMLNDRDIQIDKMLGDEEDDRINKFTEQQYNREVNLNNQRTISQILRDRWNNATKQSVADRLAGARERAAQIGRMPRQESPEVTAERVARAKLMNYQAQGGANMDVQRFKANNSGSALKDLLSQPEKPSLWSQGADAIKQGFHKFFPSGSRMSNPGKGTNSAGRIKINPVDLQPPGSMQNSPAVQNGEIDFDDDLMDDGTLDDNDL